MEIRTIDINDRFIFSGQEASLSKAKESDIIQWDINQRKVLNVFKGLSNSVNNVLVCKDNKFLAGTSNDA
jgi:WD40 repeat protein